MSTAPLIQVRNISKSYGGVHALSGVHIDIAPGEVHALCGENGAGKSTLIKILTGSVIPDTGQVLIVATNASSGTVPLKLGNVAASEQAGIAVIHQESVAFPHLNSYDNIFVGREPRRWGGLFLDRKKMRTANARAAATSRRSRCFDPAQPRRRTFRRPAPDGRHGPRPLAGLPPAHHGRADRLPLRARNTRALQPDPPIPQRRRQHPVRQPPPRRNL